MFKINRNKIQMFGVIAWLLMMALANVTAQQYQPRALYAPDRRRFNSYIGSDSPPVPSNYRDQIKFPDDITSPLAAMDASNGGGYFYDRHKKDDQSDHHLKSNEVSYIPINVTNGLNSYEDFLNFLDEESRGQLETIAPRFGGDIVERSSGKRPVPANCIPEMTVVPLRLTDGSKVKDPTIIVFPSCTRVKRCGGCCNNNLVSCQPVETATVIYEVFKSQYQSGGRMQFLNKELVEVEEHTKCRCDCRKKESDCTKFQRYNKPQCMCVCINIEDKNKCLVESGGKMWDPDSCTCRCREIKDCSTGTYFDANSCTCQEKPGYRHTQLIEDRRRFKIKPVTYIPETPETYYDSGT